MQTMKLIQKFIYVNGSGKNMQIFLEPWAEQFEIPPGERVEISVHAPSESVAGILEIEQLEDGLIVYGYEGCVVYSTLRGGDLPPSE